MPVVPDEGARAWRITCVGWVVVIAIGVLLTLVGPHDGRAGHLVIAIGAAVFGAAIAVNVDNVCVAAARQAGRSRTSVRALATPARFRVFGLLLLVLGLVGTVASLR